MARAAFERAYGLNADPRALRQLVLGESGGQASCP
jgi:hypothetical protein